MVQIPEKTLTLAEFLELPETKPAREYIDGTVIPKPMPQGKHSLLQRELSFFLMRTFQSRKTAQAFPELRCTFGERSLVPDIAIFRNSRIPRDNDGQVANRFDLPPDWVIEILSPNQSQTKVIRNLLHCLDYGTEMGWLLDINEPCLFVYDRNKSIQAMTNLDLILPVPTFASSIELTLKEILEWLKA